MLLRRIHELAEFFITLIHTFDLLAMWTIIYFCNILEMETTVELRLSFTVGWSARYTLDRALNNRRVNTVQATVHAHTYEQFGAAS